MSRNIHTPPMNVPMIDEAGRISSIWHSFFVGLQDLLNDSGDALTGELQAGTGGGGEGGSRIDDLESKVVLQDNAPVRVHDDLDGLLRVENPHDVTLEQARAENNELAGDIDFNNNDIVDIKGVGFQSGQEVTWNPTYKTLSIPTGDGPILQTGQELFIRVYNATGAQIDDGSVVYPNGTSGGFPTIGKAKADTHETLAVDYGLTTMNIPDASYGFVTWFGKINDIDTSAFSVDDIVYVSPTTAGALTNVKPEAPNYVFRVGIVTASHATAGSIFVTNHGSVEDVIINFWNGVFKEDFDFLVTSAGGVVTGSLSPSDGHDDMTMLFSDGPIMLDTNPAATIVLTAGTDINPQGNYVYIPKATKTLTVSTTEWPTTEAIRVAYVVLQSAATTVTCGALRNQNWNDALQHTSSKQGHLSHIGAAIREKITATWKTGVEGTCTIDAGNTPDDVWVSNTAGTIMQMHDHTFIVHDTSASDTAHIVNHSTTPYVSESNLNTQLLDATGASLNNTSFSFVLWGVANKTGEASHLMINLPTGTYQYVFPDEAVKDADNHSVYNIPADFAGVGFLIARFTLKYKDDVWTLHDTEDLRGAIPNVSAGGSAGGGGVTTFLGLTDTESAYAGHASRVPKVNVGETGLEFGLPADLDTLGTKAVPVDADKVVHRDSADADVIKTSTWTQVKAFLKTYFDTLYNNYTLEAHATSHQNAGGDEIGVTGLSGLLADDQHVLDSEVLNVALGKTTATFTSATELTVATGAVTKTQSIHRIDTEADAATDDLATINGGADGNLLMIRAENTARTVVLKNGTGNLELNGADILLTDTDPYVILLYDGALAKWVLAGGDVSGGGASVSDEAFGASWDEVTTIAASKNAIYDQISRMLSKGYILGGYTSVVLAVIEDLIFSNETSQTIAATLDTAKRLGTGVNSSSKGYILGGYTGATTAVIEDLIFSNETSQAIAATLDTAKYSGTGVSSSSKGYILGGYTSVVLAVIEDLIFSNETSQTIAATLDTAKRYGTGVNSSSKGYILGGYTSVVLAVIEDLIFSNETSQTIAATLDTAKRLGTGVNSSSKGYILGGYTGATTAVIEDLIFSNETSQAIAATLDTAKHYGTGINSNSKGYILGGYTGAVTAVIEDLIFSNETSQAIAATLDTAKRYGAGVQYGYV